jgi:hypothetical protein
MVNSFRRVSRVVSSSSSLNAWNEEQTILASKRLDDAIASLKSKHRCKEELDMSNLFLDWEKDESTIKVSICCRCTVSRHFHLIRLKFAHHPSHY